MTPDRDELIQRVRARGPFPSAQEAEAAIVAVLTALREVLTDDESSWLEEALGGAWPSAAPGARPAKSPGVEELGGRSAAVEGVRLGVAVEHVQIVGQALSELLSPELVLRLKRHLPRLAALFSPPARPSRPPDHAYVLRAPEPAASTLAQGRPGGARPLSEARPGSEHPLSEARPERAHRHSVARADEPHADSKLSSAHGLTQEREGESLAQAKRGPTRE